MGELFHVSSNPHIRASHTTGRIMMTVLIALMPAAVFGIFNFGMDAPVTILLSMASCVATEYIYEKLMHKKITISDCSAAVTGLLLEMCIRDSRPADLLDNELDKLESEMAQWKEQDEDVLTYALFPQVAVDFFKYRQAQETKVDPAVADAKNKAYPV